MRASSFCTAVRCVSVAMIFEGLDWLYLYFVYSLWNGTFCLRRRIWCDKQSHWRRRLVNTVCTCNIQSAWVNSKFGTLFCCISPVRSNLRKKLQSQTSRFLPSHFCRTCWTSGHRLWEETDEEQWHWTREWQGICDGLRTYEWAIGMFEDNHVANVASCDYDPVHHTTIFPNNINALKEMAEWRNK